jgi:hypothetical protein
MRAPLISKQGGHYMCVHTYIALQRACLHGSYPTHKNKIVRVGIGFVSKVVRAAANVNKCLESPSSWASQL